MDTLSHLVRLAQARERQATVTAESAHVEMQSALAVASADAAKSTVAARAQVFRKSAQLLDERGRQILHITEQVEQVTVAAGLRDEHFANSTNHEVADLANIL